jgi:hypothetical protein
VILVKNIKPDSIKIEKVQNTLLVIFRYPLMCTKDPLQNALLFKPDLRNRYRYRLHRKYHSS